MRLVRFAPRVEQPRVEQTLTGESLAQAFFRLTGKNVSLFLRGRGQKLWSGTVEEVDSAGGLWLRVHSHGKVTVQELRIPIERIGTVRVLPDGVWGDKPEPVTEWRPHWKRKRSKES